MLCGFEYWGVNRFFGIRRLTAGGDVDEVGKRGETRDMRLPGTSLGMSRQTWTSALSHHLKLLYQI